MSNLKTLIIMISKSTVKRFCNEDISLIENYDLAVNDETQIWHCHHKSEIMDDMTLHSRKWLKDNDLYYNRPASELIFMTPSEHRRLHMTGENNPMYGKHLAVETKKKLSEALKGENHHFYGKHFSDEHKLKLSESMKGKYNGKNNPMYGKSSVKDRKWMTNGIVTQYVKQSDINTYLSKGYVFGRKI